jgi:hypothetical protein
MYQGRDDSDTNEKKISSNTANDRPLKTKAKNEQEEEREKILYPDAQ